MLSLKSTDISLIKLLQKFYQNVNNIILILRKLPRIRLDKIIKKIT